MTKKIKISNEEKRILNQVPTNYYQKGIKKNLLQRSWHKGKLKTVLSLIDGEPKRVLDVGCASGWFLSEIQKKYPNAKYIGIDKYKKGIKYGNKKYKNLDLKFADAHNLPFDKNSFELIICTELLEHVEDPKRVLQEIKRVLTLNGTAIIEMDSGNYLFRVNWYWWTNLRKGVWVDSHLHIFTASKLNNLIINSKFKILRKKSFNLTMGVAYLLQK